MKVREFLPYLKSVRKSKNGWEACCPAHDDKNPSLSISEGEDGRILLNCHRGCPLDSIVDRVGLTVADLFPDRCGVHNQPNPKIIKVYDYLDENGALLFQCVRYEPKNFKQRRPDPIKSGEWIWNLKSTRRVLYRLPELKAGLAAGSTIFIAEGEKDCDVLAERGFTATCNPMGAGKWLPEHTESLSGAAIVVLIADKDTPGQDHAQSIARSLHGVVKSIKIIELPNLNERPVKDAFDFFAAGGDAGTIEKLVYVELDWTPANVAEKTGSRPTIKSAGNTPAQWFAEKFPSLPEEQGDAILEETNDEIVCAKDISEDFFAATLGEKGSPEAPTVFVPTEEKFFKYCPSEGIFVHQREPLLITGLSRLLLECARACREGCETKALQFRFRDAASLSGIVKKARGLLEVPHDYFANDLTKFIPCANGMLRLEDKCLLPFSPGYRRRNKLAVRFDAAAKCPLFLDTLMRLALDEGDLDLLQRWCGQALIGENLAQRILLLTGTAGGGKGTFIRVLTGIIGYVNLASLRTQLLGERFELGRFLGKTLLYGADVPENFLNQRGASVLKSLTGYDPVTLEFKNSNESPGIICKFNVVVTCNSRLKVQLEGDTDAWRRRLAIIEYNKPKPTKPIADLDKRILEQEASGVLNWMLEGFDKFCADGWQLNLTAKQQDRVDNLLLESEGHAVFARERLTRNTSGSLTVPDCFAAYVEFCTERGWSALTKNKFSSLIGDEVARQFGKTIRHDVPDAGGKMQRGWKEVSLAGNFTEPTDKKASETSESQSEAVFSDTTDTFSQVQSGKKAANELII